MGRNAELGSRGDLDSHTNFTGQTFSFTVIWDPSGLYNTDEHTSSANWLPVLVKVSRSGIESLGFLVPSSKACHNSRSYSHVALLASK